jgi:hypothetical protein
MVSDVHHPVPIMYKPAGQEAEAYNPPRKKIERIALFWPLRRLSFNTYGVGMARRMTSMRMFGIEMAKRNFWLSTLQEDSIVLSQKPLVGMHWSTVRRNYPREKIRVNINVYSE